MIIFKDLLNGTEIASDALPSTTLADGAVVAYETKKVAVGGESYNTGGNASKEEAEEGVEDEVKTVINLVDSHGLTQQKMEKKEYTTMQNAYWKALLSAINKEKGELLFGDESKIPSQKTAEEKEEYKKLEAAAAAKLKGPSKAKLDEINARFASFKKNFSALQKFVKDEVLANFSEFDFYTGGEVLGECMIIPARYVGEAVAPTFYYYVDGLVAEKC